MADVNLPTPLPGVMNIVTQPRVVGSYKCQGVPQSRGYAELCLR